VKICIPNVANPSMTESAVWRVRPGIALLAPAVAGVDATRMSGGAYGTLVGAAKRFVQVPAHVTGSPQSRGRLAHT
jgi:hypothetical protein